MTRPVASMTGFGRSAGQAAGCSFVCELKSVNGRGLDLRMRLAPGYDALEPAIRRLLSDRLARGSVSVFLSVTPDAGQSELVVNEQALHAVLAAFGPLAALVDAKKPSLDGILGIKGVLEQRDAQLDPEEEEQLHAAILACATEAADALVAARQAEGERIAAVLAERIEEIAALTARAEAHPGRGRDAILARLREQVAQLLEAGATLAEDRLHQEAVLLATKADIREELDRLAAHVTAARQLLAAGGPVGRKLDFLSQEFNREANTLCSKSNDVSLTAIGLDLKAAIDQLREQLQNLE